MTDALEQYRLVVGAIKKRAARCDGWIHMDPAEVSHWVAALETLGRALAKAEADAGRQVAAALLPVVARDIGG